MTKNVCMKKIGLENKEKIFDFFDTKRKVFMLRYFLRYCVNSIFVWKIVSNLFLSHVFSELYQVGPVVKYIWVACLNIL